MKFIFSSRRIQTILSSFVVFLSLITYHLSLFAPSAHASESIGPELAVPGVGSVIAAQNYTGLISIINYIDIEGPKAYNPIPAGNVNYPVVLRVDISAKTSDSDIITYANNLKTAIDGNQFPRGIKVIVLSVEVNNLDWWYGESGHPNNATAIGNAAKEYAAKFILFAKQLENLGINYPLAPSPPDLFNGNYSADPWMDAFTSFKNKNGSTCQYVDKNVADIFNGTPTVGSGYTWQNIHKYQEQKMCGKEVIHFEGWGIAPDPNNLPTIRQQIDFYQNTPLPAGISTATTLILPHCPPKYDANGNPGGGYDWWYYLDGRVFTKEGTEINPDTCEASLGNSQPGQNPLPPTSERIITEDSLTCIGRTMAYYLNVIVHARDTHEWKKIKIASPIFGLGGGPEKDIYDSMIKHNAEFDNIDAFAGNTYNTFCHADELQLKPTTALGHFSSSGFQQAFSKYQKPVIFTEFNDTCLWDATAQKIDSAAEAVLQATTVKSKNDERAKLQALIQTRTDAISLLTREYSAASGHSEIIGINLFNALNTNPNWEDFQLYEDPIKESPQPTIDKIAAAGAFLPENIFTHEITTITAADKAKGGIHSANTVMGDGIYAPTADLGLTWTVEIFRDYPWDQDEAARDQFAANFAGLINSAFAHNPQIQPILRPCNGDECIFKSPAILVDFIDRVDPLLNGVVWLSAGPNEPSLEHWLSKGCNPCADYIIDPDNSPNVQIPPECMAMKITPQMLLSNEYEAVCHGQEEVSAQVDGAQTICVSGNCQGVGSAAYQFTPTIIPLLKSDSYYNSSVSPLARDWVSQFTYTDTSLPEIKQRTSTKANSKSEHFHQTKAYLVRLQECINVFDQSGCYLPKKIRGSTINEKDLLSQLEAAGITINDLAFTPLSPDDSSKKLEVCDSKGLSCRQVSYTYEAALQRLGLLTPFNNIEPFIHALVPTYRVSSVDTISPQYSGGFLESLKAFVERFKNETPTLSIDEFYMYTATLSPFQITRQVGGVEFLTNPLFPKYLQDQHQKTLALDQNTSDADLELYLKGPVIFNVDNMTSQSESNPLIPFVAAKINKDRPVCQKADKFESSARATAPAFSNEVKGLGFFDSFLAKIKQLSTIAASGATQTKTAYVRHFTVTPTRHEQENLDNLYNFMSSKYTQEKDQQDESNQPGDPQIVTTKDAQTYTSAPTGHDVHITYPILPNSGIFSIINRVFPSFQQKTYKYTCYAAQLLFENTPGCEWAFMNPPSPPTTPTEPDYCTASSAIDKIHDDGLPFYTPHTQLNQSCVQLWTDPQTAQKHAEELKQNLAHQQRRYTSPTTGWMFSGWAAYYGSYLQAFGLDIESDEDLKYQHLFGSCCGHSPCFEYVIDRTLSETYLDPYVVVAIALNETGGLTTTDPHTLDPKSFGCDPFCDARTQSCIYQADVGDKLTCVLESFNKKQNLNPGGADCALSSYGYLTSKDDEAPDEKTCYGTYNGNLNTIINYLSEGKYGGLCHDGPPLPP